MTKYSKTLNQNMSIDSINGTVLFDDGTIYTRKELKYLKGQPDDVLIGVHKLKSKFNSEVVR